MNQKSITLTWQKGGRLNDYCKDNFNKTVDPTFPGIYLWVREEKENELHYIGMSQNIASRLRDEAIWIVTGLDPIHSDFLNEVKRINKTVIFHNTSHYKKNKNLHLFRYENQTDLKALQEAGYNYRNTIQIYYCEFKNSEIKNIEKQLILNCKVDPPLNFQRHKPKKLHQINHVFKSKEIETVLKIALTKNAV